VIFAPIPISESIPSENVIICYYSELNIKPIFRCLTLILFINALNLLEFLLISIKPQHGYWDGFPSREVKFLYFIKVAFIIMKRCDYEIYQTKLTDFGFEIEDYEPKNPYDVLAEFIKNNAYRENENRRYIPTEFNKDCPVPVMEVVPVPLGYVPGKSQSTIRRILMSDGSIMTVGCFGAGRSYIKF
jgi:hypothetical protein